MHWLYDLPVWLMASLFVLGSVALGVGGVLLVRRLGWHVSGEDNGTAAALHAFVGVVYAVALGLIVVAVQGEYGDVEEAVMAEASAAGDLYLAMDGLEPPARQRLRRELTAYVDLVIRHEWPAVRNGRSSPATWRAVDLLARDIHTLQPASPGEERIHPELLSEIDALLDARRLRLFHGQHGIGAVTWIIVLLGGVITLGFACFFSMERLRSQLLLTGLMGSMFGLMLFLIVAMDHPLWGSLGVEPHAFHDLETNFARLRAEEGEPPLQPPAR